MGVVFFGSKCASFAVANSVCVVCVSSWCVSRALDHSVSRARQLMVCAVDYPRLAGYAPGVASVTVPASVRA